MDLDKLFENVFDSVYYRISYMNLNKSIYYNKYLYESIKSIITNYIVRIIRNHFYFIILNKYHKIDISFRDILNIKIDKFAFILSSNDNNEIQLSSFTFDCSISTDNFTVFSGSMIIQYNIDIDDCVCEIVNSDINKYLINNDTKNLSNKELIKLIEDVDVSNQQLFKVHSLLFNIIDYKDIDEIDNRVVFIYDDNDE